jgi:hypothetical protein
MIKELSRKWYLDDTAASRYITARRYSPEQGEYEEDWILPGVQFTVRFQADFPLTDTGRVFGQTFGTSLGGYIGVSLGFDSTYHVGTPANAKSKKLIMAMEKAMNDDQDSPPTSRGDTETTETEEDTLKNFLWHVAEKKREQQQKMKGGSKCF